MNHKKLNHKKTHRNCLAALLALAMISAPHASADGTAFGEPEGATRTDGNLVAGLAFNASTDGTAQVNRVGYWDQGGDGLDRDHVVGLFQRDPTNPNYNWKLLAKATVTSASPLEGGYRWADLGTTILLSNTTADGDYGRYAVLAETGSDPWGNRSDGVKPSFDPAIVASIATFSSFWYEAQAAIEDVGTVYGFMGNENVFAGPNIGYKASLDNRPASTTILVRSGGANPSDLDAPATFTATVSGSTPTGSVRFYDGGTTLLDTVGLNSSFEASLTASTLAVGVHNITAQYVGDSGNYPSTSDAVPHTVTGPLTLFGTPSGTTRTDYFAGAGIQFNANASGTAQINQVGFWDQGGDGLAEAHTVGIFQRDPETPNFRWKLLAKATVPAGSAAPLQGGYRWVSLGTIITLPDTLPAGADADYGQYAILADGGTDPMGGAAGDDTVPLVDGGAIAESIAHHPSSYWFLESDNEAIENMAAGDSAAFNGHDFVWFGPNARFAPDTGTITAYDTWIAGTSGYFPGVTDSLVVGPNADPDKDGKPNFLEFALNSKPNDGGSDGAVFVKLATVNSVPNVLTLTAAVRSTVGTFAADGNNQKATDTADSLTYIIEAASDLTAWGVPVVTELTGADATAIQTGLPLPDSGWVYKTFRTDGAAPDDPADFIRVKITSP
jgi:hypothetical protein